MIREIVFILIVLLLPGSCKISRDVEESNFVSHSDLDELRTKGKITAVTDFNSVNYFIYRGTPMGFHYELLRSFSEFTGINIEVITTSDINKSVDLLNSGAADIIAIDLPSGSDLVNKVRFTLPLNRTGLVLVQRKPSRWTGMSKEEIDRALVRNVSFLAGKMIYVQSGSGAAIEMHRLNKKMSNKLTVIEVPFEAEKIISLVAKREIDYAVCDENTALVNSWYFPVVDISTVIRQPEDLGWGVRKTGSEQLINALNDWIQTIKQNNLYTILYSKYFRNEGLAQIFRSEYYTINTGKISPWDAYIKKFSETIGWDWRLLAALIYQESRFRPDVVSNAGAHGLMQVLPSTGESMGIDITSSPEDNIKGGVLYLSYLQKFFEDKIPDENERIKFVLASYNAGAGNILDAMRLAEKYGKNPLLWDGNVEYFLLKKSDPKFYNDPVVQFGYCKGDEPVNFVAEILNRYAEYKNFIP